MESELGDKCRRETNSQCREERDRVSTTIRPKKKAEENRGSGDDDAAVT